MTKRFKLRIPTFKSCRSKNPSSAPLSPTRRRHLSTTTTTPPPPPQPHLYRSKSTSSTILPQNPRHPNEPQDKHNGLHRTRSLAEFRWRKEDRWLVITKINLDQPSPPSSPSPPRRRKIDNGDDDLDGDEDFVAIPLRRRRRRSTIRLRLSTSSTESNLFTVTSNKTAGGDSSLGSSFSTDSSIESTKKNFSGDIASISTKMERIVRSSMLTSSSSESDGDDDRGNEMAEEATAARLSVFKRLIPCGTLEGSAVRESMAVVKRSEDPYEDFRRSMMEMVLEKHLFEMSDLERVLQILLALNSKRQHGVIVEAFEEIKEALFCRSSLSRSCSSINEFLKCL